MNRYSWRTWAGGQQSVEADEVTFEPGHVAFWRRVAVDRELVLAVTNTDVQRLSQDEQLSGVVPCPTRSPVTGAVCVLPDLLARHESGHEGLRVDGVRTSWPTTEDDRARWETREEAGQ